jgi:hypothetical protein
MANKQEIALGELLLDQITDFIRYEYNPEDIFDDDDLEHWAESNGYIKEE